MLANYNVHIKYSFSLQNIQLEQRFKLHCVKNALQREMKEANGYNNYTNRYLL